MTILDEDFKELPKNNERQFGMSAHLMGLFGCLFSIGGLIITTLYYFGNRTKSSFVREHCARALNFQIVYFLISSMIQIGLLYGIIFKSEISVDDFKNTTSKLYIFGGLSFLNLVLCVRSAIAANKGEIWRNPITINFVK